MEPSQENVIACPACGKNYFWKPAMAGCAVKCNCGALIPPSHQPVTPVS